MKLNLNSLYQFSTAFFNTAIFNEFKVDKINSSIKKELQSYEKTIVKLNFKKGLQVRPPRGRPLRASVNLREKIIKFDFFY